MRRISFFSARDLAGIFLVLVAAAAYAYANPARVGFGAEDGLTVRIVHADRFAGLRRRCAGESFQTACLARLTREAAAAEARGLSPLSAGEQMRSEPSVLPAGAESADELCRGSGRRCETRGNESAENDWSEIGVPEIKTVASRRP